MAAPLDILDERDPLRGPFIGALLMHVGVVALLFFGWLWMNRVRENLGDLHPAGGPAYDVSPVNKIPIPQRQAPQNPVAADTQSTVPTAPAKQELEKKLPIPDKDAFQIPDKKKHVADQPLHQQKYMQPAPDNQVYSRTRTAVSSPMYGQSGSGQVGIGPNSPLGNRLGWYAEIVRQRIAQQWLTNGLDARSQQSPAIVSFTIMRDGRITDVRVIQPSGNPNIDNTAQRAVYQASPLPALPPQITDNSISAQFTFNLR
ncbi:MAG: TonB family protein [Acidobacteriota bacterium]|nr:TonB family protein [Acidobacteriota bacterium]